MNDFNGQFKQREEEFDRDWQRARKLVWVRMVVNVGILLFVGWVIVMVLHHFGII